MSELPPRQRLARIVRELVRQLPGQMAGLLDDARFDGGRAALTRLGNESTLDATVASLAPDEAERLADRLLARWQLLAPVALEPAAAIDAPDEVWVGDAPVRVELTVRVVDADPGWEVVWDGATAGPDPAHAVATAAPPGEGPAVLAVRAPGARAEPQPPGASS